MGLKVSITLPGHTVITVESDEPDVFPDIFKEVVRIALQELPTDLIRLQSGETSSNGSAHPDEKIAPEPVSSNGTEPHTAGGSQNGSEEPGPDGEAEGAFIRFTSSIAPVGDMRRVVAAAEGARRFLHLDAVSETELGHLFDLAGWLRPGSFIQTLRNAGRSKFRWLARVPGNPGYYAVTPPGREAVIPEQEA